MTSELSLAIEPGLAVGLIGARIGLVEASGLSVTPEMSLAIEVGLIVGLVGAGWLSRIKGSKGGKGGKGDRGAGSIVVCYCYSCNSL